MSSNTSNSSTAAKVGLAALALWGTAVVPGAGLFWLALLASKKKD